MGSITKHGIDQIIEAIKGSRGIKTMIALKLDVNRQTVDNYLKRYPTAMAAYQQEIETVGDVAESVVIKDIHGGNVETSKWYLTMKCKSRGYVKREEVTGPDGTPQQHVVRFDLSGLTDEELDQLDAITSKIAVQAGDSG